jgi:hypothetical protein
MKYFITILLCCFIVISVSAQVPQKISYQGLLTTSSDTPVQDGSYELQFGIYNLPIGGDLKHEESQSGVSVEKGTFSVILHPPSGIFSESLYVQITITDGPGISHSVTLLPRSELTTAPYAFRSDTALYALNLVCAGTASGMFGTDIMSASPKISIVITHTAFQSLEANQVVATACAYVPTGGSPPYMPLRVAARPVVISGTLRVELWFDQNECTTYDGKTGQFAYILTRITNN